MAFFIKYKDSVVLIIYMVKTKENPKYQQF